MANVLTVLLVIFLATIVASLPAQRIEAGVVSDRPGYCKVVDVYIKEGDEEIGPLGICMRMKCISAAPGKEEFSGLGCGYVHHSGCPKPVYDLNKRYPECCPKVCDINATV